MRIVYTIKNLRNGKVYVGQTRDMASRWREHCYEARQETNHPLYRAMRKYGVENFVIGEESRFRTRKEASKSEILLIKSLQSLSHQNGYNVDLGGHLAGKHSAQTRKKIGDAKRGTKHSEETKRLMSKSQKGKPKPKGFGLKISAALLGRKFSKETKRKLRLAWLRRKGGIS